MYKHYTPFTEPFTEEDAFEEPSCNNPNISQCEEEATDCENQWKCCSSSESTVSCQMDLDTATGTCGENNECLGPVDGSCCYKVLCNCTTTTETTTSLPMTTKPIILSTTSKKTTDNFDQTSDTSDASTMPHISSSVPDTSDVSTMPHISSSVPQQKIETLRSNTDPLITSNHSTQSVDQPSSMLPSDGSPSPSNNTGIAAAKK